MIQIARTQAWVVTPRQESANLLHLDLAELLVNEAHHRIKNSLQVVAAMLHLQARRHLDLPGHPLRRLTPEVAKLELKQ